MRLTFAWKIARPVSYGVARGGTAVSSGNTLSKPWFLQTSFWPLRHPWRFEGRRRDRRDKYGIALGSWPCQEIWVGSGVIACVAHRLSVTVADLLIPLRSKRRRRDVVGRLGRRNGRSVFGLVWRITVGLANWLRRWLRRKLRYLGEAFHRIIVPQWPGVSVLARGVAQRHRIDPAGPYRAFTLAEPPFSTGRRQTSAGTEADQSAASEMLRCG